MKKLSIKLSFIEITFVLILLLITTCFAYGNQGGEVIQKNYYSNDGRWCIVVETVRKSGHYSLQIDRPGMSELILVSLVDGKKRIIFSAKKMGTNSYDSQYISNVLWSPNSKKFTFVTGFLEGTTYYYSYDIQSNNLKLERKEEFP